MVAYTNAFAALGVAVLFLAGILILGVAMIIFARALAETQRYRSHRLTTDGQEETLAASQDALEEIEKRRSFVRESPIPSDEELRVAARAQTLLEPHDQFNPEAYPTTDGNAMRMNFDGEADVPPDRLYVPERP
jgi:hypothetical protein